MSAERPLAIVTGAAGGIGSGVARMLRGRGFEVVAVDIDAAAVERAVALQEGDALGVVCDARDPDAVRALAERIREEWATRLEVLVCNAGVIVPGDAADAEAGVLDAQIDVMLRCPIQLISAGAAVMRERGTGHLLATVSMGGIVALPGSATYSAAKAGLRAYLWALHAELAGTGVRVSGVYPSGVDTAMLRHEATHGGSMLNFVGKVFTVDEVVRAYGRALDRGTLEVYLPVSDAVSSKLSALSPAFANRLIPVLERWGARGHARYLARIASE